MQKKWDFELIFVLVISIVMAFFANITYILSLVQTPPDMFYLGVTHHFQDYFFYVSQIMQGIQGHWLTNNLFTSEPTISSILYWPNILLGHIGRLFHLSPITTFNLSVFVLLTLMLVSTYVLFKRIFPKRQLAFTAFLLFLFSTSILNRLPKTENVPYWPFYLWGTPHLISDRLTTVPHHIVQTMLFCGILLFLFDTQLKLRPGIRLTLIGGCVALLTLIQPVIAALMIGCYSLSYILSKEKKHLIHIPVLLIGFFIPFLYMFLSFKREPHLQLRAWEFTQQTVTTTWFLLLSIGPILPLALSGIGFRIKRLTHLEWFGLLLICSGYLLFRFPDLVFTIRISNVRVLSTGTIIFLAWFAAAGIEGISTLITKRHKKWKTAVFSGLFLLFFIAVTPTIIWEIRQKLDIHNTPSPIVNIPKTMHKAFLFISKDPEWQHVVLANSTFFVDTLVPALSGHQTYSGHPLTTINSMEKTERSKRFFQQTMNETEAYEFVKTIPITYVLFTVWDGDVNALQSTYPFLNPLYSTETAVVYSIKKDKKL